MVNMKVLPTLRALAVCASLTAFVGCADNSNQVTPAEASISSVAAATTKVRVVVDFEVLSPKTSGADVQAMEPRSAVPLSPATKSVKVETLVIAGESQATNLTQGTPGCRASAGATLCRVVFSVPQFTHGLKFTTFDGELDRRHPTGKILATGTNDTTIEGREVQLKPVMDGVVHKVSITSLDASPKSGTSTDLGLKVEAFDPDGYPIRSGGYADRLGNPNPLNVGYVTLPAGAYADLPLTVNGKKSNEIAGPSNAYQLRYIGRGIVTAQLFVSQGPSSGSNVPRGAFARAIIAPQPASFTVAGSPRLTANAQLIAPVSGTEAFIDTAKHQIALLVGSSLSEEPLPSGNTPTMIALGYGYFQAPLLKFAFATQQNTVGIIDNQDDVSESSPISGGNVVSVSFDGGNFNVPVYAQTPGTIGLYWNPTFVTYKVSGTPKLANIVALQDGSYAAADPGNNAIARFYITPEGMQSYTETPLPSSAKGKALFVAAGPNLSIWVGEQDATEGFVAGRYAFKTRAPLTSLAMLPSQYTTKGAVMAGTDTAGNIELFDQMGKYILTYTPHDGAATDITSGADQNLYYVCPTCTRSIHELLY
jgi:hypothetical protein